MTKVNIDWLQSVEALQGVPAAQLQWLLENSEDRWLAAGDQLLKPGLPFEGTFFQVSGRLRLYNLQNNEVNEITIFEEKSITGYLPFSRGKVASLYAEAIGEVHLVYFPLAKMPQLMQQHFELTQALVHVMTTRVRDYTSLIRQNEKMLALGKLSAGLAHELNNPAAAVVRGADALKKHLKLVPAGFEEIASLCMRADDVEGVKLQLTAVLDQTDKPLLTMLQRSEQENELADWLDDNNIDNSLEMAENFTEFAITVAQLEAFKKYIPDSYLSPIFNWIHRNLVTEKLVADIEQASRRIGQLVGSVKSFTHMDQGQARQWTDVHSDIRNTLVILGHKLRKGQIQVQEQFSSTLPQINVRIGEMNQVWTNLIDNALDAMSANEKGILEIKTEKDGDCVVVAITDNGPGVPEDIRDKIFDPFFTTKEVGKGTGLGLDITSNIVRQHKGSIKLQSVPGRTTFIVSLPVND